MISYRTASLCDLSAIVDLLADDILGTSREVVSDPVDKKYIEAFEELDRQDGNQIILAVDEQGDIKACLQLTIVAGLARHGAKRATIEAVRVKGDNRGLGVGEDLFRYAIGMAKEAQCELVQLTTDIQRPDAQRFYERLDFEASHVGMKLNLS